MPDAPPNEPSVIVTSKSPGKRWKNGRIIGTQTSEGYNNGQGHRNGEGSSTAAQINMDVEIMHGMKGVHIHKQEYNGENRNPFRKAKVSGIPETDRQHYQRLSIFIDRVPGMSQVPSGVPSGFISFDRSSGALWYQQSQGAQWERAVFHHWIRDEISQVENTKGEDVDNCEHGLLSGDITCFSSFKRRPSNRAQSSFPVNNLRYNGILVIDYGLSPVRAFREFPLVLSSQYAGTAMRDAQLQNGGIKTEDFLARMPPVIQERVEGRLILKPLYPVEVLGGRMRRTRGVTGLSTRIYPDNDSQEATVPGHGAHDQTLREVKPNDNTDHDQPDNTVMQLDRRLARSAPPKFLPEDQDDARNLSPITAHEAFALWEALDVTADHFVQLTGREPLRNEDRPAPNYCAQWLDMQNQLRQIWDRTPPAPPLVSRGKWTKGIGNWESGQLSMRG